MKQIMTLDSLSFLYKHSREDLNDSFDFNKLFGKDDKHPLGFFLYALKDSIMRFPMVNENGEDPMNRLGFYEQIVKFMKDAETDEYTESSYSEFLQSFVSDSGVKSHPWTKTHLVEGTFRLDHTKYKEFGVYNLGTSYENKIVKLEAKREFILFALADKFTYLCSKQGYAYGESFEQEDYKILEYIMNELNAVERPEEHELKYKDKAIDLDDAFDTG